MNFRTLEIQKLIKAAVIIHVILIGFVILLCFYALICSANHTISTKKFANTQNSDVSIGDFIELQTYGT